MFTDRQVSECLLRVRNDPTLAPLVEFLTRRQEAAIRKCVTLSGKDAKRAQGRAQELTELLDLIAASPTTLNKMAGKGNNPGP